MALSENKRDFAAFLTGELIKTAPAGKTVIVAGGLGLEVEATDPGIEVSMLRSDHEEADIRVVLHWSDGKNSRCDSNTTPIPTYLSQQSSNQHHQHNINRTPAALPLDYGTTNDAVQSATNAQGANINTQFQIPGACGSHTELVPMYETSQCPILFVAIVNSSIGTTFEPKYATDEEGEESLSSSQSNSEDDEKASRISEQSWCDLSDNFIILIGGYGAEQLCSKYDAKNKTFSNLKPLPCKRVQHVATIINSVLFICGGFFNKDANFKKMENGEIENLLWRFEMDLLDVRLMWTRMTRNDIYHTSMERFDVEIGQWLTLKSSIGVGREGLTLTIFKNQLILIGGQDKDYKRHKTIQKYDLILDSWSQIGQLDEARSFHCTVNIQCAETKAKSAQWDANELNFSIYLSFLQLRPIIVKLRQLLYKNMGEGQIPAGLYTYLSWPPASPTATPFTTSGSFLGTSTSSLATWNNAVDARL
ncbi:Kelch-like protein 12 [Nymphon striatum]|nr:Kelch-like protein 12 [Nymphon striatum]